MFLDDYDNEYNGYIKGKRICFVGGGSCNIDKGIGGYIDNFDIVVRTNNAINLVTGRNYKKDFGSKTDVLYINNQYHRHNKPLPIHDYKAKGVQWICCKIKNYKLLQFYALQGINARSIAQTIMLVSQHCQSASMGNFAWYDILKRNPKELFITGIDFFSSRKKVFSNNDYREYIPGYLPQSIINEGNQINAGKEHDGHDFYKNADFTYLLTTKFKNFTMADETRELLYRIVKREVDQV